MLDYSADNSGLFMDNPSVSVDYSWKFRKALRLFFAVASGGFFPQKSNLILWIYKTPKAEKS